MKKPDQEYQQVFIKTPELMHRKAKEDIFECCIPSSTIDNILNNNEFSILPEETSESCSLCHVSFCSVIKDLLYCCCDFSN